jgi:hypothetical protein
VARVVAGVHDAVVKAEGETRRYLIKPGGGAAFAAVVIAGSTHVTIRIGASERLRK